MTDVNKTISTPFLDTCDGDYLMLRNGDDLTTSPLILIHPGIMIF